MKHSLLLATFVCLCMMLQIFSWKLSNPSPVNWDFSRKFQGTLFKDEPNRQLQTHLILDKDNSQPLMKQRVARDLMTGYIPNNHRIPMAPALPYNRPGVQNGPGNPSVLQNVRGPSPQTRYRQAMSLPSSPVRHSLENMRPQSTVRKSFYFIF